VESRKLHNDQLMICTPHPILYGDKIENEMGGACSAVGEKRGVYRFWWGNLKERDHEGDPGVDGKIILGWIFSKWDVGVWTGLGWLRIWTRGGHLCIQ
jgi:hypothetical protein